MKYILWIVLVLVVLGGLYWYSSHVSSNLAVEPIQSSSSTDPGSVKQDAALIVSESIVGKWQSTDDAKFVREFKSGDVVVDSHDGKVVSEGKWVAFTKANAPLRSVAFPIDENAVYIQMTTSGTEADTLNFKVGKLTPEELELVYMERGGTLKFKFVQ